MGASFEEFLIQNRHALVIALVGMIAVGAGIFLFRAEILDSRGLFAGTKVEVIQEEKEKLIDVVTVEVAGEVENPGVYEFDGVARVENLLVVAGGLSAMADREWVEKSLNRAAKLVDGGKIYIPRVGELVDQGVSGSDGQIIGVSVGRININTASAGELDKLWGIGTARAQIIIENRPYSSADELLAKKIVPSNVYERIKDKIIAP